MSVIFSDWSVFQELFVAPVNVIRFAGCVRRDKNCRESGDG